jgi:hypothetical protein
MAVLLRDTIGGNTVGLVAPLAAAVLPLVGEVVADMDSLEVDETRRSGDGIGEAEEESGGCVERVGESSVVGTGEDGTLRVPPSSSHFFKAKLRSSQLMSWRPLASPNT